MNSNQLPVSGGLAVFLAVIVGYFVIDPSALDGFRPGGESSQIEQVHGIEDVQARLWQDPVAAAARHKNSQKTSPQIQLTGKIYIPVPMTENNTPQKKVSKDTPQKIDLHSEAGKNEKAEFEKKRHSLEQLRSEICEEAAEQAGRTNKTCREKDEITVLAVMVPAGPYAKPAETRKRMRYAVLSALGIANYYPKDAEHIGYVDDLNTSKSIINVKKEEPRLNLAGGNEQLPHVMPYEWYENTLGEAEKHVLLLWLDEDAFGKKALTKLDVLFASLGKHVSSIKMIGPYGSTLLKAMVMEAQKDQEFETLKKNVDVFSATATAVDSELAREGGIVESIL
ncbi:MAG: hypothetical protein Q9M25_07665, partial [Mariprofundaceae bacterium]|nr:hypothetical protein [Mariprofundaceae bacterium]